MKYIDAEKLIAEIERRIESWDIRGKNSPAGQGKDTCVSRVTELSDLLSFITSLHQEQPEVDLEKDDIIDYVHSNFFYDKDFDGYGHSRMRPVFTREDIEKIARHFYELGLNARKEGNK